jgi:hypothetical protein
MLETPGKASEIGVMEQADCIPNEAVRFQCPCECAATGIVDSSTELVAQEVSIFPRTQ